MNYKATLSFFLPCLAALSCPCSPSPLPRSLAQQPTTGSQSPADAQHAPPWPTPTPSGPPPPVAFCSPYRNRASHSISSTALFWSTAHGTGTSTTTVAAATPLFDHAPPAVNNSDFVSFLFDLKQVCGKVKNLNPIVSDLQLFGRSNLGSYLNSRVRLQLKK